jgi:hypothetical protein
MLTQDVLNYNVQNYIFERGLVFKCYELLSTFAFNFKLRRYSTAESNKRYAGRMGSSAADLHAKQRRSPSFVFLGGSVDVGLFKNCFGDANSFFRRSAFLALGGYSEDRRLGYEDWELYTRAAYGGYSLEVGPSPNISLEFQTPPFHSIPFHSFHSKLLGILPINPGNVMENCPHTCQKMPTNAGINT